MLDRRVTNCDNFAFLLAGGTLSKIKIVQDGEKIRMKQEGEGCVLII
jgi:hypothetical protein